MNHNISYYLKELGSLVLVRLEPLLGIKSPSVSVLLYHSISYDNTIVDVTPENFAYQIKYLKRHFDFITLDQVLDYIQGKYVLKQQSIALTFDDGYQDVLKNVVPVLKKYKIPATIFVLADPYGVNRKELANNKKLLNFAEIKKLQKAGWTIGCHTATHADLSILDKAELKKEIVNSKVILEEKLGRPINFFSYPKGIYDKNIILEARKANYKAAFTTDAGIIKKWNDFYKIPRLSIDGSISSYQFPVFFTSSLVFYFSVKNKVGKLQNLIRIKYEK